MSKYENGKIVKALVSGIEPYGVFVKIDEEYSGLIHISELSTKFVRNISDYVKINEIIYAKILSVDEANNKLSLSIKDINFKYNSHYKKRKIYETKHGFETLKYKLPIWIEENLKKHEKNIFSIDKYN